MYVRLQINHMDSDHQLQESKSTEISGDAKKTNLNIFHKISGDARPTNTYLYIFHEFSGDPRTHLN
jgi:hypothetical protein